jgi:LSD1 subclass zinc finger protein
MPETKSFNCPNCGSPLTPNGDAKEIKCAFCSSTVIVPEELRDQDQEENQEWTSGKDPYSPQHLQWLIQNGADATAKIDTIKDKGETVVLYWSGTKAAGGQFKNHAEINIPRSAIPRRGDTIKIKYNPDDEDEIDFAFQIDGRFYRDTILWD